MLTDAFRSGFGIFLQGQHAMIFPGIAIAVLSVNFIGDGLRDAFDLRHRYLLTSQDVVLGESSR